ncbi:MAG: hypothetical protein AAFX92_14155 [Pseudomonadota bacterium]
MTDPARRRRERKRFPLLVALVAVALLGQSIMLVASAEDWTETNLTIVNGSDERPLICQFLLAHWFEVSLGPIRDGAEATQMLAVRAATGDVAIVNTVGDHMAVERLMCGEPGADRAHWSEPSVDRLRHGDNRLTLRCRPDAAGADCQFE